MGDQTLARIYEQLKDRVRRGELPANLAEAAPAERERIMSELQPLLPELPGSSLKGVLRDQATGLTRELEVRALAERVFRDKQKAESWLFRPNASLAGQVPADLMKSELGAAVVRESLEQIDHGIFA